MAHADVTEAVKRKRAEILNGAQKYWEYYIAVEAPKLGFDTEKLSKQLPSEIKKQVMQHPIFGKEPPSNLEYGLDDKKNLENFNQLINTYLYQRNPSITPKTDLKEKRALSDEEKTKYEIARKSSKEFLNKFFIKFRTDFMKKYGFKDEDLPDTPPQIWFEFVDKLPPGYFEKTQDIRQYERTLSAQLINYFSQYVEIPENSEIKKYYDTQEVKKENPELFGLIESTEKTPVDKKEVVKKETSFLEMIKNNSFIQIGILIFIFIIYDRIKKSK